MKTAKNFRVCRYRDQVTIDGDGIQGTIYLESSTAADLALALLTAVSDISARRYSESTLEARFVAERQPRKDRN